MARPIKTNADWFSHDADMRNDTKIKAVRRKFGHLGYSIWSMLLEILTKSKGIKIDWDELNIELIAGDFDVDSDKLVIIIEYFNKLKMIDIDENSITCPNLTKRLQPLFEKRENDRAKYNSRRKPNGEIVSDVGNAAKEEFQKIKDAGNTQSKVKQSKLNEIKVKKNKVNTISNEIVDERGNSPTSKNNNFFLIPNKNQVAAKLIEYSGGLLEEWESKEQAAEIVNFYNGTNWHFAGGGEKIKTDSDFQKIISAWGKKYVAKKGNPPIRYHEDSPTNKTIDITPKQPRSVL